MRTVNVLIALCGFGGLATTGASAREATAGVAVTAPTAATRQAPEARTTEARREIVFNPPRRGAPRTRTGGGTRNDGEPIEVAVLVPEDTGLTLSEQPTLYWRLSEETSARFEFVLTDERQVAPLWRESITDTFHAGVHPLRVSAMNLTLTPGVTYRWFVALVRNPDQRSNDVVSSGTLERVASVPGLDDQLGHAQPEDRAAIFAAHGLWYDALHALNQTIEAHPDDSTLQAQRNVLLRQVGISSGTSR